MESESGVAHWYDWGEGGGWGWAPGTAGGPPHQVGEGGCEQAKFTANICTGYLYKMGNSTSAKAIRRLFFGDNAQIVAWRREGGPSATIVGRLGRHWWSNCHLLVRAASMENQAVPE